MTRNQLTELAKSFIFNWFPRSIKAIIVICALVLVALVFAEVWLRYILKLPLLWVEEITVIPAFWLYLLGAAYGAYERTQIKVDVLDLIVKDPRRRMKASIITAAITVALACMFVAWGFGSFVWDLGMDQRSYTLLLPMIWARSSIFFGALIMAFYFVIELVDLIRQYQGKPMLYQPAKGEEPDNGS